MADVDCGGLEGCGNLKLETREEEWLGRLEAKVIEDQIGTKVSYSIGVRMNHRVGVGLTRRHLCRSRVCSGLFRFLE